MKLTIKDRVVMPSLYPKESNIVNQILVKDIKEKVELTQPELKEIDFKPMGTHYSWDMKKAKDKKVDFTEAELDLLKNEIDKLDKEKKITQDILPLCLKIREVKEKPKEGK
jgi:hypothetical protein